MNASDQPSPWVKRFAPVIKPGGTVLDFACGYGRHTRHLAARGFNVEAVDRDADALAALATQPRITTRCADLENGPWPYHAMQFDGVVVSRYLYRPRFAQLLALIADDGVLIYETFMVGHAAFGKPSNPDYLLQSGELLDVVRESLTVVAFEQGRVDSPQPAMIQRICAVRRAAQDMTLPAWSNSSAS